jgi:hypothetical protein
MLIKMKHSHQKKEQIQLGNCPEIWNLFEKPLIPDKDAQRASSFSSSATSASLLPYTL